MNHQIDLLAICPFYINLLLEGLEDFQIIGKVCQAATCKIFSFYLYINTPKSYILVMRYLTFYVLL